ncbi:glutathione S-transferase [Methylovirgula ligni]|uniref:Glutathione S-transferase n=1 Tax=Methylovirgula ligni TaxID=569860 RepID=A0A3D9Z256_9HYPH|nr:glutathione S-transferase family protein [Methylovirgula ligni]REF89253.1 glutathione S-transferase [Methylovirgula ligni]
MLVLYFSPGSSSLAVHIALHEAGAAFEAQPVLVATQETRKSEFLAVNAEGKVPSLLIDGRLLTEVLAILFYVGRTYPQAKLLPEDIEGEAQALSWMSFLASTVHGARADAAQARDAFSLAAHRLGAREWALGDYSVVDIFLFRLFWRFAARFDFAPGEFPSLEAHRARMLARPAVIKTFAAEAPTAEKAGLSLP